VFSGGLTVGIDEVRRRSSTMRFVLHRRGVNRVRRGPATASLVLVSALVLLAFGAGGASASGTSAAAAGSFCGLAGGVAKTALGPTTATTSISSLESKLKTDFGKFEAAEPALIGAAPSAIKSDLRQVFGVDNALFQDLKTAHWNFLALATDEKSLEAEEAKIKVPLAALEAYFKSSCGIKEP
jgi:hypothetical protein